MARAVTVEGVRFERYEAFRKWAEGQPGYWILVRGVPMPSPSPSRKHQKSSLRLLLHLVEAVLRPGLGEVYAAPLDVKLGEDTVYQPDLLVVLREHADRLRETHIEGAPDLVVEVVSPFWISWRSAMTTGEQGCENTGWWIRRRGWWRCMDWRGSGWCF